MQRLPKKAGAKFLPELTYQFQIGMSDRYRLDLRKLGGTFGIRLAVSFASSAAVVVREGYSLCNG